MRMLTLLLNGLNSKNIQYHSKIRGLWAHTFIQVNNYKSLSILAVQRTCHAWWQQMKKCMFDRGLLNKRVGKNASKYLQWRTIEQVQAICRRTNHSLKTNHSSKDKSYLFVKRQIMAIFHRKGMQNAIYAFRYSNNWVDPDTRFHFKKIQNHLVGAVSAEFRKHICCGLILINGFRFNEKYLIGKRVPNQQKPREMTSQNCNWICYSTHVASNFIMRGIKNFHRKVMFIIFTKIFLNLTITIHIDHIWFSLPVLSVMAISNKNVQLNYADD